MFHLRHHNLVDEMKANHVVRENLEVKGSDIFARDTTRNLMTDALAFYLGGIVAEVVDNEKS